MNGSEPCVVYESDQMRRLGKRDNVTAVPIEVLSEEEDGTIKLEVVHVDLDDPVTSRGVIDLGDPNRMLDITRRDRTRQRIRARDLADASLAAQTMPESATNRTRTTSRAEDPKRYGVLTGKDRRGRARLDDEGRLAALVCDAYSSATQIRLYTTTDDVASHHIGCGWYELPVPVRAEHGGVADSVIVRARISDMPNPHVIVVGGDDLLFVKPDHDTVPWREPKVVGNVRASDLARIAVGPEATRQDLSNTTRIALRGATVTARRTDPRRGTDVVTCSLCVANNGPGDRPFDPSVAPTSFARVQLDLPADSVAAYDDDGKRIPLPKPGTSTPPTERVPSMSAGVVWSAPANVGEVALRLAAESEAGRHVIARTNAKSLAPMSAEGHKRRIEENDRAHPKPRQQARQPRRVPTGPGKGPGQERMPSR